MSHTDHVSLEAMNIELSRHKSSLSKFKKTEIIPNMFADYSTKTRNQLLGGGGNYKKHKHMKANQCATK